MIKRIALIAGIITTIFVGVIVYGSAKNEYKNKVIRYKENALNNILPCIILTKTEEFCHRLYKSGVPYEEWSTMSGMGKNEYVIKTVETPDTTFQVRIRDDEAWAHEAIKQFIFKGFKPIELKMFDSLFIRNLQSYGIKVGQVFTEYVDIKKNAVIYDSGGSPNKDNWYKAGVIELDILNSVGVKCYVEVIMPEFKDTLSSYMQYFYLLFFFFLLFVVLFIFSIVKPRYQIGYIKYEPGHGNK